MIKGKGNNMGWAKNMDVIDQRREETRRENPKKLCKT
jgi:hypothetical protein